MLYLPLITEVDGNPFVSPKLFKSINPNSSFQLSYSQDSTKVKEALLNYQIEDLTENNVQIFSGEILSQKIPLTPK